MLRLTACETGKLALKVAMKTCLTKAWSRRTNGRGSCLALARAFGELPLQTAFSGRPGAALSPVLFSYAHA